MSVNLSALAGAAQQFFTDTGTPLSGGKLYSYAAGTTTPQTTYTDNSGAISHTNPIVLNAAGRVPTGEIWLSENVLYKFVLKTSDEILIATWDDIPGFNPVITANQIPFTGFNGQTGTVSDLADDTGSDWIGFLAGAPATARSAQSKMRDLVSVKDFGAVGDQIADDYQSIQAAIDYAFSVNKGIYFPSGVYKINTGLNLTVGCESAPNAQIRGGAAIDVVTIAPGNYAGTYFNFPQIAFGTNGLVLNGVALATVFIPNIALCSDNGLVLQVTDTNKVCADNVITFNTINGINNGAAVKFSYLATTTSGVLMQGNQIKGNFAVNTLYGVYFYDVNSGALGANLPWDDTQVDVFAIDPNNLAGSIGFYANANFPAGRTFLYAKGFFDAMDDAYIKGSCSNNPIFAISNSGQWDYTKFKQTGSSRIINASTKQGNLPGVNPIPTMTTTYNTLATFNSGVPLQVNRNILQFTVVTPLASGDTATFYFYHMLMSQYKPKVTAEAIWDAPMYVQACCESSTPGLPGPGSAFPYPFQGTLVVRATGVVPAGTYLIAITVEDVTQ